MTTQVSNQTQRRLANDLSLNVLRAMKYHAIIVYSCVSKKALALVQSLHLPIKSVQIIMKEDPVIEFEFRNDFVSLEFEMDRNNEQVASLNDHPVNVKVLKDKLSYLANDDPRNQVVTMSNQGMTLREWIQHLCSISNNVKLYEAEFRVGGMEFDIQLLRNTLPKLRKIHIYCTQDETGQNEIICAQNLMRAFLSNVQDVQLYFGPLHFPLEHVGMANLNYLQIHSRSNLNYDFLFTLNVESCSIHSDQMPLRDLNRFFKLWIKGSNPRLMKLFIWCDTVVPIVPDWNVLLKGLRSEDAEAEGIKKYIIRNCRGIRAQIEVEHLGTSASVIFLVSN
ncbi:hypothetical protein B9Z55_011277 [Caenorhabditis nigoni]|uniref:Sdz-33 F-box domain-containing protein n=1 Tax=Caenorhabditis nigoni TaxID=1611254 RepID=A0A2G5UJD4_9PELO|nr:hypothetical protein B9Z55_011277 [Caenorhabditis nigoni]